MKTLLTEDVETAREISRTLASPGGQELVKWVKNRVEILNAKDLAVGADISVEDVKIESVKKGNKKIDITILSLSKDQNKAEIRVWRLFLLKLADWERLAQEGK